MLVEWLTDARVFIIPMLQMRKLRLRSLKYLKK